MYRSALRIGDHGEQVTQLNTILKSLGYSISNSIDSFDQKTYSAVISFQNDHNINITGMADEKTLRAIEKKIPEKLTEDDIYVKRPESKSTYEAHEVEAETMPPYEIDMVEFESAATDEINMTESESLPSHETHEVESESSATDGIDMVELESISSDETYTVESESTAADGIDMVESESISSDETYTVESESAISDEIEMVELESISADEVHEVKSESTAADGIDTVESESISTDAVDEVELKSTATDEAHEAELEFMTMDEIYAFESETMTTDEIYANDSETGAVNKIIESESVSENTEKAFITEATYESTDDIFEIFSNELAPKEELFVSETGFNPAYEIYINETESIFKDDINTNHAESVSKNEESESEAKFEASYSYKTRPNLKKGSTGHYVTELQDGLKQLGYSIRVDGIFGRYTEYAVISFQASNNLLADGIVGAKTWNAFENVMDSLSNHPAVSNPTLKEGSDNIYVKQLQNKLSLLGYYNGPNDSIMGYNTSKAVKAFQEANNLKPDGIVGPLTWLSIENAITSAPANHYQTDDRLTLKSGASGEAVVQLQNKLNKLGYYNYITDGLFGFYTEAAVRNFQKNFGLIADGIYGPETAKVIDRELFRPQPAIKELREVSVGGNDKILQEGLEYIEYFSNNISGNFDPDTAASDQNFQCNDKINHDDIAGKDIWNTIYGKEQQPPSSNNRYAGRAKPALRYGSTGEHVAYLQKLLANLMLYGGRISGEFDCETLLSVKCFQDANSIMPDGIVDRITWSALESLYPQELFYDK